MPVAYEPVPNELAGLLYPIEELARHAGHVDIIRETIDGVRGG